MLMLAPATTQLSALVPVGARRAADLPALHAEYRAGLDATALNYEIIYVIDGQYPELAPALNTLLRSGPNVSVVQLTRAFGESTALMAGFERAAGDIILTLPPYHQIQGSEIPRMVQALATADIIVCRRQPRTSGWLEGMRRGAFHGLVNSMTGMQLHDLGCSARALKRAVLNEVTLYGDQHRLLPALANRQGFRVLEIDVQQSLMDRYEGGYRTREYLHRMLDLFAVFFLVRFTKKPLRFFGMVGASLLFLGAVLVLYLVADRLLFAHGLADRPALLLSSLLVVLGLQLFALGLLGELIIFTHARDLKDYQVERVIEYSAERLE